MLWIDTYMICSKPMNWRKCIAVMVKLNHIMPIADGAQEGAPIDEKGIRGPREWLQFERKAVPRVSRWIEVSIEGASLLQDASQHMTLSAVRVLKSLMKDLYNERRKQKYRQEEHESGQEKPCYATCHRGFCASMSRRRSRSRRFSYLQASLRSCRPPLCCSELSIRLS